MEFKKYPKREPEPEKKYKVCICGHYWHNHELGFMSLFQKCKICECSNYKEIGRFTYEEADKLGVNNYD